MAAFDPGFVDYRREPNGGVTFKHPDGRDMFFYGPEADQMASDIDKLKPPAPVVDPLPVPTQTAPIDPIGFRDWYKRVALAKDLNPDPDAPDQMYDYRSFYNAMKKGEASDPRTKEGHFDSRFKMDGHPREFMQTAAGRVFDTKTGKYVGSNEDVDERLYDDSRELTPEQMASLRKDMARGASGGMGYYGNETASLAASIGGPDRRLASYDPNAPFGSVNSIPDAPMGPPVAPPGPSAEPLRQDGPVQQQPGPAPQQGMVNDAGYPVGPNGDPFVPQPMTGMLQRRMVGGNNPQAKIQNGVMVPTGQTVTREGVKNYSEELQRGYGQVAEAEQAAAKDRYEAQAAVAEDQRLAAEAALPGLQRQALDAQIKQDIIRRDVEQSKATYQQLADEAATAKIENGGIWRQGTAQGIGTLISAALTGLSSAMLGRGPSTFDVIQNAIDRDIAQQKSDIAAKGARANNALQRYTMLFGDQQMAESALKGIMTQRTEQMASRQAAMMGTIQAKQAYDQLRIAAAEKALGHAKEFEDAAQGKATVSTTNRLEQPTRGGLESDEAYVARLAKHAGNLGKVLDYNHQVLTGGAPAKTGEQAMHQNQLVVNLPNGDVAYAAAPDRAKVAQDQITEGEEIRRNFAEQRAILEQLGESASPAERARYNTLVARNTVLIGKGTEKLGALTTADSHITEPLTGEGGQDLFKFKSGVLSQLNSAESHINFRIGQAASELFQSPDNFTKGNRYKYGGRDSGGVKKDGAISSPTVPSKQEVAPAPVAADYPDLFGGNR